MSYYYVNSNKKEVLEDSNNLQTDTNKSIENDELYNNVKNFGKKAKSIINSEPFQKYTAKNNISLTSMIIGMGLGIYSSFKFKKSILLMTFIGGSIGLIVGNIIYTSKIYNKLKINNKNNK